jgi:PUA domain protein
VEITQWKSTLQGAIKFILSGADIMCPGLTSKGAFLDMETEKGAGVQVESKIQ